MNNKITIKNISTTTVCIIGENKFRRELVPGREIAIPRAVYDELMYDSGFNNLLAAHFIRVTGVAEDEAPVLQSERIYDAEKIAEILKTKNYTELASLLPTATIAEKDSLVELAIKNDIVDNGVNTLIKKYCGVDVISAINQKHQAMEK